MGYLFSLIPLLSHYSYYQLYTIKNQNLYIPLVPSILMAHIIKARQAKVLFRIHGIKRVRLDTYDMLDSIFEQLVEQISASFKNLYPNTLLTPEHIERILREKGYKFKYIPTTEIFKSDEVFIDDDSSADE